METDTLVPGARAVRPRPSTGDKDAAVVLRLAEGGDVRLHPDRAFRLIKAELEPTPLAPEALLLPEDEPKTRFVCISDTHGNHTDMEPLPEGDVLIHAGDFTNCGELGEMESFLRWFVAQPHRYKVVIAGNHEICLQEGFYEDNWKRWHKHSGRVDDARARRTIRRCKGVIYLRDEPVEVLGYRLYGTPWQPEFFDWAFNLERGEPCAEKWARIPEDVEVLITHTPPLGFGDRCKSGSRVGCADLLREVLGRVHPMINVFGHIHEDAGIFTGGSGRTTFINASTCTLRYQPTNPPVVFDLPQRVDPAELERRDHGHEDSCSVM